MNRRVNFIVLFVFFCFVMMPSSASAYEHRFLSGETIWGICLQHHGVGVVNCQNEVLKRHFPHLGLRGAKRAAKHIQVNEAVVFPDVPSDFPTTPQRRALAERSDKAPVAPAPSTMDESAPGASIEAQGDQIANATIQELSGMRAALGQASADLQKAREEITAATAALKAERRKRIPLQARLTQALKQNKTRAAEVAVWRRRLAVLLTVIMVTPAILILYKKTVLPRLRGEHITVAMNGVLRTVQLPAAFFPEVPTEKLELALVDCHGLGKDENRDETDPKQRIHYMPCRHRVKLKDTIEHVVSCADCRASLTRRRASFINPVQPHPGTVAG